MKYLIYYNNEAYLTNFFEIKSMYAKGMVVFDFGKGKFFDGNVWKEIEEDSR